MPQFRVHMYGVVRFATVVDAEDQAAALRATDRIDLNQVVRSLVDNKGPGSVTYDAVSGRYLDAIEYADDLAYYLVDEVGDRNYERSRYYDDQQTLFDLGTPKYAEQEDASIRRRLDRKVRRVDPRLQPKAASDAG